MRSALACTSALVGMLSALVTPGVAQDIAWPKPMTIVVPFPPGGSNDIFARLMAQRLGPKLGTNIVVDNKGGAGGTIGAAHVSRSAPNGATLLLTSSTFTTTAAVQANLPFDPIAGFTAVAQLAKGPMILTVGAGTSFNATADLLAAARAEKGKLNYGTAGIGSINHMAAELLTSMARIEMTHVPYKGISAAITDMMGARLDVAIASFPSIFGQIKSGKVRGLAVTSPARSQFAPELPTVAEAVPGYDVELWWGVLAPPKLPDAMVARLNSEIVALAQEPEMRERIAQEGAVPTPISATAFAGIIKRDVETWRSIARERKITAE